MPPSATASPRGWTPRAPRHSPPVTPSGASARRASPCVSTCSAEGCAGAQAVSLGCRAMPTLDRDGDVYLLNLGDDENRFNPEWVGAVEALLDEVAAAEGPRALVTTATGKIWSNGLDLEWMGQNAGAIPEFVP